MKAEKHTHTHTHTHSVYIHTLRTHSTAPLKKKEKQYSPVMHDTPKAHWLCIGGNLQTYITDNAVQMACRQQFWLQFILNKLHKCPEIVFFFSLPSSRGEKPDVGVLGAVVGSIMFERLIINQQLCFCRRLLCWFGHYSYSKKIISLFVNSLLSRITIPHVFSVIIFEIWLIQTSAIWYVWSFF